MFTSIKAFLYQYYYNAISIGGFMAGVVTYVVSYLDVWKFIWFVLLQC